MRAGAMVAVLGLAMASSGAGCGSEDASEESASGGVSCSDSIDDTSCTGEACGGDIVGSWGLIDFCGPACVSSVYESVSFSADGAYNGGQGTWEYQGTDSVKITVGNASSTAPYCVTGNRLWIQHYTNCGPDMSGPLTIVRPRVCDSDTGEGGRR